MFGELLNLLLQFIEQRTGKELTKRDIKTITELFNGGDTQNIVRLEVDDGNGIQVIDIDSGKPFAIVLPLNVGNICFYDTNGNVVEYLRQQL